SAQVLPAGLARDLLGARLTGGPSHDASQRAETAQGWTVEAAHDAWIASFGVGHERRITLSPDGLALTGADRLVPVPERAGTGRLPFAVRFHIHPDVRVSPLEGGAILLKLPNGDGWRFRAGAEVAVEESVYLGGGAVRRGEQLVLTGEVGGNP